MQGINDYKEIDNSWNQSSRERQYDQKAVPPFLILK